MDPVLRKNAEENKPILLAHISKMVKSKIEISKLSIQRGYESLGMDSHPKDYQNVTLRSVDLVRPCMMYVGEGNDSASGMKKLKPVCDIIYVLNNGATLPMTLTFDALQEQN